jgi:GH24 family phage-related lysozyme (muramidase)
MSDLSHAINLIRKYEGFSERAFSDPDTGTDPYTIGYGTQFYPDGSPVKRGQFCTKEKALEYLFHEVEVIDTQLQKLNLGLDTHMRQALISFVHSIGWDPFFYSDIVDALERDDTAGVVHEMSKWIFDAGHQVIGGLLDRRREEIRLFLAEAKDTPWASTEILLTAFRNYTAAPHEVRAIRHLEEQLNPYILSGFANNFRIAESPWKNFDQEEYDFMFNG